MAKTVQLRPCWSDKHIDYMQKAYNATITVAEGAVRAGKTVDNIAVFAKHINDGTPDRIHLATGSTSANAKLNIGDCNGMGLEYIFRGRCHWTKYKGNDALSIRSHNRDYIVIFAGGAKADSFKKIRGNSYGMWIATEINLHNKNTIEEAFNRQLAAKNRRVLWDLNPSAPAAEIYTEYIDKYPLTLGNKYNYCHFTIRDNKTISVERLEEIESQYDKNSIWYRRDILGERCKPEGLVYDMFSGDLIIDEEPRTIGDYFVSSDYGIQNATVFLLWRKSAEEDAWICLDEYCYSGRDEHKQKTVSELCDGLFDMIQDRKPERVIIDPSAAALIVEVRKRGLKTQGADNDVNNGIADVSTMLTQKKLKFMRKCKNTIAEFGLYSWDEKASEKGEDVVIKTNDHSMDAVRYFVKTRKLVKRDGKHTSSGRSYLE